MGFNSGFKGLKRYELSSGCVHYEVYMGKKHHISHCLSYNFTLTLLWPAGHTCPTYKESFQVRWDNSIPLFLHTAIYLEVSLFHWTSQNAFSRETAVYKRLFVSGTCMSCWSQKGQLMYVGPKAFKAFLYHIYIFVILIPTSVWYSDFAKTENLKFIEEQLGCLSSHKSILLMSN